MRKEVAQSIIILARSDAETDREQLDALVAVCQGKYPRNKPKSPPSVVDMKGVRSILGRGLKPVSIPTVESYVRKGKLHEAPRTGKKRWFYREEAEALVYGDFA